MAIVLPDETKDALVYSIKRYVQEELEQEIGDLQAQFLLEFVLKEVGPSIYNKAIQDAQARMQVAVADLDATLHEPEFGYTALKGVPRKGGRR